ncbi:MAG TPA: hypothetical protein VJC12_01525 [Candidatus Paceibacterota bacterium]
MKSDIWEEGKYLDLWSVNHVLSGVLYTGWILKLGFGYQFIFITYFVLAVGWEFYEKYVGVKEHLENQIMDVVTGVAGFFMVYIPDIYWNQISYSALIVLSIIFIFLEIHGYITYKKRINKALKIG